MGKRKNIKMFKIENREQLQKIQDEYASNPNVYELMPWAANTPFTEIAENIISDRDGEWATPLYFSITSHKSNYGAKKLCRLASEFLDKLKQTNSTNTRFDVLDVLSISSHIENGRITLNVLVRPYINGYNFIGFFNYIGDSPFDVAGGGDTPATGVLLVPDEIKNFKYSDEELKVYQANLDIQNNLYEKADYKHPLLNSIEKYTPRRLPMPEDHTNLIYDLKSSDMQLEILEDYEQFNRVFRDVMAHVSGIEYYKYCDVISGNSSQDAFMATIENYIKVEYIGKNRFETEDLKVLMEKIENALFHMYILQDLIDNPEVTDIKITRHSSIRARVRGKAYSTNIHFVDDNDYRRFIEMICIRNKIKQNVPAQTFTDQTDARYIMRFSLTSAYITPSQIPILHIRKIDRNKYLGNDLIRLGMFDEKIRDFLIDAAKTSRGVVFAGPPGSGKTICLNWFLEEGYEQSAEILVIQENDELFSDREGIMFEHVVNYPRDNEQAVNLEQLGQLALVAGANVFVIGEVKGPEICSAIRLGNAGCRTALTTHSESATETIPRMADLALSGEAKDIKSAMRMLKTFQTIVYLENFKVKEISEIVGFDETSGNMQYRYIYRREAPKTLGVAS